MGLKSHSQLQGDSQAQKGPAIEISSSEKPPFSDDQGKTNSSLPSMKISVCLLFFPPSLPPSLPLARSLPSLHVAASSSVAAKQL
eukprot:750336-Hanusia_phi.AAC.2